MSAPEEPETEEKPEEEGPKVTDRWWVDTDRKAREAARKLARESGEKNSIDHRFFRTGVGYDQDRAHARLTDINLKILSEANPEAGQWSYLGLVVERPFSPNERERIIARLPLPPYARGVVVDSGKTIRLVLSGTPSGRRILEVVLSNTPSLDCWVDDDWVRESVFPNLEAVLTALPGLIVDYLSPEGIVRWEDTHVHG